MTWAIFAYSAMVFATFSDSMDGLSKVIVSLTGFGTMLGILYNIFQNRQQARRQEERDAEAAHQRKLMAERAEERAMIEARQREEVKTALKQEIAVSHQKLEKIDKQTNGINKEALDRALKSEAEAAESKIVLKAIVDKVKKIESGQPFDPNATVIKLADEISNR